MYIIYNAIILCEYSYGLSKKIFIKKFWTKALLITIRTKISLHIDDENECHFRSMDNAEHHMYSRGKPPNRKWRRMRSISQDHTRRTETMESGFLLSHLT